MADIAAAPDPSLTNGAFLNPAYATPNQRAQLYAYANELMKPQPVKTGWQGLAEIARALVGGYAGHQADVQEQAARRTLQNNMTAGAEGYLPPTGEAPPAGSSSGASGSATPAQAPSGEPAGPTQGDFPDTQAGHESFIRSYAASQGVEPNFASSVASAEGLRALSSTNPNSASGVDIGKDGKPFSFGDFQLNVRNGLGNEARAAGIDPADPTQWQAADKFAIDHMAKHDISPWKGDKAVEAYRSGSGQSDYSTPRVAPAVQAIASALTAPKPVQVAQNGPQRMPVSAQAIGALLSNPDANPAYVHQLLDAIAPKMFTDATGRVLPSFQNQPVAPPIANLGVRSEFDPSHPTAPVITGGSPTAPQATVAVPNVAGAAPGAAGLAGLTAPTGPFGPAIKQGQENTAQAGVIAAKAAANQTRFQRSNEDTQTLQTAAYPLRQLQAVLDKNGGVVPTGHGADEVMNVASIGNMIGSLLGHPLTGEDSSLTSFELMRKYGTQVAMSITGHPTDLGLQAAEATSPGGTLSPQANMHLVDNYVRLNALAQKKAQFEHDYYLSHGQGPSAYDNFNQDWMKEISGAKAIPLSKFGRDVKLKDGTEAVYVPSTDPKGFSLFRKDDPAFDASAMTPGVNP